MEAQVRQMAGKVDKTLAAALPKGMASAAAGARGTGLRAAQQFGGAYETEVKKSLVKAYQSLPEFEPDMKLDKWQRAVKGLRQDMKGLAEEKFGPDLDEATFARAVEQMGRRLRDLMAVAPRSNDRGFFDLSTAQGEMSNLYDFVREATRRGEEAAEGLGGAFQKKLGEVLTRGVGAIPKVKVDADTSDAERKLQVLRADMQALSGKTIGVDISAEAAFAEVRRIQRELELLDRKRVDVEVRTDARSAAADLAAFVSQAGGAAGATEGIGHAANFSLTRLGYLIGIGASLGSVIVPAAGAAAAAIALIGTSAIAGVAGLGAFALGVSGIAGAVGAMNQLANDQEKSTNSINQANRRLANSSDQVRMAELSLANTRANIADQEFDAAQRVAEATRSVSDARRDARLQQEASSRAVREAQRDVTAAEEDAIEVRRSLNDAIRQATQDISELDTALARNTQDQSKATTAQLEALEKLNALKANPRATEVELRKAADAYNEQTVRLQELRDKRAELTADQERANKLGVEGDERVIAVRKRIADADERVARAREKVELAEAKRALQEEESARRIADARRGVADAQRAQDRQARNGAYQLASATNAVEAAQRTAAQAFEKTGIAGGEALDNLKWEMDQLSPAGQRFAKFIFGLKDEALALRDVAQENLLPGLQEAITLLLPYLPGFSNFIGKVAFEMGRLAVSTAQAFGNPTWQRFFKFVDDTAVPSLAQMYETGMNLTEGLLELLMAMDPFNKMVGKGLLDMSQAFADWAREFKNTEEFKEFLAYLKENVPEIGHFLSETGELLIDLIVALAPIGDIVLHILTKLVDGLNSIPTGALTYMLGAIALLSTAIVGLGAIMKVVRFKRDMQDIFGPANQKFVRTYAIETGRATEETGRFRTALAATAGFTRAQADRLTFLNNAALNARTGMGRLADHAGTGFRAGMDHAATAAAGFGNQIHAMGEKTRGARNWVAYLGDDLARSRMGQQLTSLGGGAQFAGDRIRVMGDNVRGARNYLSYLADDLARGRFGPQFMAAAAAAQTFGDRVRDVGTKSISGMRTAAVGLTDFLGGPWGLALAGATLAAGAMAAEAQKQKERTDTLTASLAVLRQRYDELKVSGREWGKEADEAFRQIVANNPDLQKAVITLDQLGVSFRDMVESTTSGDPSAIIAKMNEEIDRQNQLLAEAKEDNSWWGLLTGGNDDSGKRAEAATEQVKQLTAMRDAWLANAKAVGVATKAEQTMEAASRRNVAMASVVQNNAGATRAQLAAMATEWDRNQIAIDGYNKTLANFGDGADAAARRADDLSAAIERQYGAAISANEANEKWNSGLISLRESVDANGRSMSDQTREGLANRDAIEAVALASRDMFIEEVRLGGKLPEVTKKHEDRIEKLRNEAYRLGLTDKATDDLIDSYGKIDPAITTKYNVENFDVVFMKAQEMRFAQEMLEKGITDEKEAKRLWKSRLQAIKESNKGNKFAYQYDANYRAAGGPIVGPGTGTSDDVMVWASNGEHMLTAAEVKAAGGHESIYAWRKSLMAGGQMPDLPKYAKGGAIAPFKVEFSMTRIPSRKEAEAAVWERFANSGGGGMLGGDGSVGGWRAMERVIKAVVPSMTVSSDLRVGDPGYHGRGRAIDMIFSDRSERRGGGQALQAFNFISSVYGKKTKELIWDFSPWGLSTGIWNGGRHRFGSSSSGPGTHDDHIHWAFDNGGWMMPGMQGVNLLKEPEPVLTPGQWSVMEDFVKQGMVGGTGRTYQFEFRDTTLDAQQLRDMQARDDALARVGRGR